MKRRITRRQFVDWCAFYKLEPWDGYRGDVRIAKLCDLIAQIMGDKTSTPAKWMEFVEKKPQTARQFRQAMDQIARFGRGETQTSRTPSRKAHAQ